MNDMFVQSGPLYFQARALTLSHVRLRQLINGQTKILIYYSAFIAKEHFILMAIFSWETFRFFIRCDGSYLYQIQ